VCPVENTERVVRYETVENVRQQIHVHEEDIKEMKRDLKEAQNKIQSLETRMTVNERDIKAVFKQLTKIDNNTTWILRLILGSLLLGIIGYFIKVPLH
jgi:5-bromo-4-chloroindolyl phosphate hydrolysis protein